MVEIIFEYNPSKLDNKIINIICKKIKISKIGDNYKFKYHTQKYQLKEIITKIFYESPNEYFVFGMIFDFIKEIDTRTIIFYIFLNSFLLEEQ